MKIEFLDIETAPKKVYAWGLFNQNIGINQVVEPGRTICWASLPYGKKRPKFMSEFHHDHEEMVNGAWEVLDQTDVIVTFNGNSFDLPTLNTEFLKYGLAPPTPYKSLDLYRVVRSKFRFDSNKLDYVLRMLGLDTKLPHKGMDLWTGCMNGNPSDWATMKQYNIQDVKVMPELYELLLPWIDKHPNWGLFVDSTRPVCTNCGSHNLQSRGKQRTATRVYNRYQCNDCGTWTRSRFCDKAGDEKHNILTQTV